MPPNDVSKLLASSDRALIERTIRQLLLQRSRDDIESMLSVAHPDIVYTVRGARKVYPYSGRHQGIEEIRRILTIAITEYDNLGSVIHTIAVDGAVVVIERTTTLRHRGTNAVAEIDIVDILRFKDGRIIELSEHADTLALEQLSGRLTGGDD